MKKKLIENKIFEWYDLYLLQWTREECDKFVSKELLEEVFTEDINSAMHYFVPRKWFICIYENPKVWVVLHELNHFIQRMLEILRIPSDSSNTELVSNLWAYYWEETLKFYKLIT